MNRLQRFEQSIRDRCGERRKARLNEHIWPAFEQHFGAQPDGLHPRPALLEVLEELRAGGIIAFPKSPSLFERGGNPPLPQWIEWQDVPEEGSVSAFDHRLHPWHPRMAWVAGLPVLRDSSALLAIDEFLKGPGRTAPFVPVRERSLTLFGDEKRLDSLLYCAWFASGRLTLGLLRCEKLSPPFLHRCPAGFTPSADVPVLIVENHHTWHTFSQWNETSRRYAAVIYGAGTHFEASAVGLDDLLQTIGARAAHYFGDLDPEGIQIPARVHRRQQIRGLTPIVAAEEWYQALLTFAAHRRHPWVGKATFDPKHLEWLPESCRDQVAELFTEKLRLPQEYVGLEYISKVGRERATSCAP